MVALLTSIKVVIERNRGRVVVAVVLVVGMYFVVAFGEQAWKARALQGEVASREATIATMQAKHDQLRQQLSQYQSPAQYDAYVERIARRDLSLAHPGETVILTHLRPAAPLSPTATPATSARQPGQVNWQRWLSLFGLH